MTKQHSFTKHEHMIIPGFRQNINRAESTEDVKKFFVYTIKELFEHIFEKNLSFEYDDIKLLPNDNNFYKLSERLMSLDNFKTVWNDSDLQRVLFKLAETAVNRYKHLKKGPEKTDLKIRM